MLSIDSISFSFGKNPIFENLDLSFEYGKTYGIIGANGIGKTTLFRSIARLYKTDSGQISLDGSKLNSTQVTFLPTDPFFYPYMKGAEYLEIVQKEKSQLERSIQLSKLMNLPLDHLVDTYSTGMKKKLAFIARYTQNKAVGIYDEPFNGVDLESNEILSKLLQKDKNQNITLISSHILGILFEMCDEIIHIEEGFTITNYQPATYKELKMKIRDGL